MLPRLRARVAEETLRVPEKHVLMDGILFAGVVDHQGAMVFRRTPTQLRASVPSRRGPSADWRRPSPPPDGAQHAYVCFDGATRNNPGPAAGGCGLKASNGIDTLLQDSDFLGKKTDGNMWSYSGSAPCPGGWNHGAIHNSLLCTLLDVRAAPPEAYPRSWTGPFA